MPDGPEVGGLMAHVLPRWQPWAALAAASLPIHFAWEMLQAPLYLPHERWAWLCAQASAGDVVITLLAYAGASWVPGTRAWIARPRATHVTAYLAIGLGVTVLLEFLSVYRWGRWAYGPNMPRLLGIGVAPLAQWIVVPALTLWLAKSYLKRYLGWTHSYS